MIQRQPFNYREYLANDARIMGGETVFKGTRVPLRTILASLAAGESPESLLRSFPTLTTEHMRAAIAFAAASAREDMPFPSLPNAA